MNTSQQEQAASLLIWGYLENALSRLQPQDLLQLLHINQSLETQLQTLIKKRLNENSETSSTTSHFEGLPKARTQMFERKMDPTEPGGY